MTRDRRDEGVHRDARRRCGLPAGAPRGAAAHAARRAAPGPGGQGGCPRPAKSSCDLVEQTKPRLLEGTVWYLEDAARAGEVRRGLPALQAAAGPRRLLRLVLRRLRPVPEALAAGAIVPPGQPFGRDRGRSGDPVPAPGAQALRHRRAGARAATIPGYQINPDALRWLPGHGEMRPVDRTRLLEAGEIPPEVNRYFVECYRRFVDLKCVLEAREHTAQVASEDREDREDRFRTGDLPLLFCSPTMELGVDIAQLNVVNLRNVPPTPANYAQRSGRAGRGGQPALVYTYCAGRSPHDQYYFRQPEPDGRRRRRPAPHRPAQPRPGALPHPRHLDGGGEAGPRQDPDHGPGHRARGRQDPAAGQGPRSGANCANPAHRAAALAKANQLVDSIRGGAGRAPAGSTRTGPRRSSTRSSGPSTPPAIAGAASTARPSASASCTTRSSATTPGRRSSATTPGACAPRRRARSGCSPRPRASTRATSTPTATSPPRGSCPATTSRACRSRPTCPGRRRRKGRDEFVSRPRFLAISEFGPRALIYHEGARYRVYKVNLDFGSDDIEATHELRDRHHEALPRVRLRAPRAGHNLAEVCDRCGAALDGPAQIDEPGAAPERQPEARPAHHLRRGGAPALRLQAGHRLPLPRDRRQPGPQGRRGLRRRDTRPCA